MDISDWAILWSTIRGIPSKGKNIASMFLEQDQYLWYQWLCEKKIDYAISYSIFIEEMIAHYGVIKRNTLFIQLANL